MNASGALRQRIRYCVTDDGVRLAFAVMGRGPTLVKAANWLTHLEHDVRSPLWRPLLARLATGRTLVRYDQRGCGLSDRTVAGIEFDKWVLDLRAVIDCSAPERFDLLGISQGAAAALAFAAQQPERVRRLVLCGGFARGDLCRGGDPERVAAARAMIELVRFGWGSATPSFRHVFSLQFLPHAGAEQLRRFDDLQRVSATPEVAARTIEAFDYIDVSELAPRVTAPTLVLHSRHDARVPFEEGRQLAASIPGAEFVPLDSHNHLPIAGESAFDEMTAAIDEFLGRDHAGAGFGIAGLTPREREVLDRLARGLANEAIAADLGISPKTVRNHVSNIFDKLGAASRGEAIVKARDAGFGLGD